MLITVTYIECILVMILPWPLLHDPIFKNFMHDNVKWKFRETNDWQSSNRVDRYQLLRATSYLANTNTHSERSTTFVAAVKDCPITESCSVVNLHAGNKVNVLLNCW